MANITASVSNDADDADVMTTQCRRTWRYKLGYLATMLLLFGCEFDSQNPGIIVSPTAGIVTTESGATAQFTIALNSKPDAMVTIPIRSSNTNEGVVDPALVSFSASDWSTPKTVSVIGVDDSLQDGDTAYSINFEPTQSGDQRYQNLTITAISAVNRDNDNTAGITITPNSGLLTAEDLTADTFTLVLNKQPANTVNITVTSSDTSEGTVSPGSILFTTDNWNSPQTVTVTGVDDTIVDGDVNYNVGFDVQSTDSDYNAMVLT
ncbi:MAG: hypothetical protein PVF82_10330, partial [Gammaproteobacteria bacterium]